MMRGDNIQTDRRGNWIAMNILNVTAVSVILLTMVSIGRVPDYHPISVGTYFTDDLPGEEIVVLQSEIRFFIRVNKDFVDRKYKYTVLPDGRIQPYPMTSSDAIFGVGMYDWYWDGNTIIQKNPKTGKTVKFQHRPSP